LAIIRGLKHWDYLLKGAIHPVLVITDHANLQFHRHAHKIGPRIAGYIAEREQYDIQLVYKPGASNRADALSRRPDYAPDLYNDTPVVALPDHLFVPPNTPTLDLTAQLTNQVRVRTISLDNPTGVESTDDPNMDVEAAVWICDIEDENLNTNIETEVLHAQGLKWNQDKLDQWRRAHHIEHRAGDLWWKGDALVVVGNDDLKRGVISLFHDHIAAGHPGIAKTTQNIAQYYWWPGMRDHITQYIKGCATCQMNKVNTNPTKPPLYPITPITDALPFQTIALDFITKLPESDGYDTILTITDHDCSKASIFIPCKETIDSEGVTQLYAQHVVPHYGTPKKVISDRDTRFTSNFTTELCKTLGIKQNISTAYHPQTDGQSERTNQLLEQYLRIMCANDQHTWNRWLPLAQYVRNSWPSSTTKKTPYELILGYTPTVYQPTRLSSVPGVTERLQKIQENRKAALEALQAAQNKMIKENKYKPFQKGNKVWLEGSHLKLPYATMKLAPRRYGPFKVVAKVSNVAYKIQLPTTWKIHDVFHASLLTPYNETNAHGPNFLEPPPDLIEGEPEWEVEMILGDRIYRNKKQYLIRWKGYAPAHDLWEDESGIHTPRLIADYKLRKLRDQSAAQSSHQSAPAKTPQPQSAPPKRQNPARIRTLEAAPENPPVHVPPRQGYASNHCPTGTTNSDPSPSSPRPSSLSRPLWKANHRSHLEDLAEKNDTNWVCSIGLTVEQADQSRIPSPLSSSFKYTESSSDNSGTPHQDHSPATINQCHSLVSPERTSQPAMRNDGSSGCSLPLKTSGTNPEPTKGSPPQPATSRSGTKTTLSSYQPSTPEDTDRYLKTIHLVNITLTQRNLDGTKSWRTTPISGRGSSTGETENPNYTFILRHLKKQNWPENDAALKERRNTDNAACVIKWNLTALKNGSARNNSNSNSNMKPWMNSDVVWKQHPEEGVMLRSAITAPTKNFFSSSLAPTRSLLSSSMTLNCTVSPSRLSTGMSLNCTTTPYSPSSTCTSLNCNFAQTPHDMPSGLAGGLGHLGTHPDDMPSGHPDLTDTLGYRLEDMPSGPPDTHSEHVGHLGHLGYLGLLGQLGYLNVLDPEHIDLPLHTFIEEEEDT
jgi:Integrase zinc binding domain/Chromo (CHRromatin Organisation MOdifier) domain